MLMGFEKQCGFKNNDKNRFSYVNSQQAMFEAGAMLIGKHTQQASTPK